MSSSVNARVQAYLDALPGGIAAYPEFVGKYSVVRAWLEGNDRAALRKVVPREVHPLLEDGVPITRWVSEVHATCIYLAIRELFFPSDDAFVDDAFLRNVRLLEKPMYKILMRVVNPSRAAKGTAAVFSQMHRGLELSVDPKPEAWIATLTHPPLLLPDLLARCYATALRAALEVKGYQDVTSRAVSTTPESTTFRVTFE
ncbi:MAG: hypothetical protein ACE37F_19650 [Nannocystaceae bacterium]|nr:hypothetical protein [bacterium]